MCMCICKFFNINKISNKRNERSFANLKKKKEREQISTHLDNIFQLMLIFLNDVYQNTQRL